MAYFILAALPAYETLGWSFNVDVKQDIPRPAVGVLTFSRQGPGNKPQLSSGPRSSSKMFMNAGAGSPGPVDQRLGLSIGSAGIKVL